MDKLCRLSRRGTFPEIARAEQIAGVEGLEHLGTCVLGACRPLDAVCRGLRVVVEVETLEAERRPHEVASEPLQTSLVHR